MFIPIGDEPNPRTTPWVTTLIVVANCGLWLLFCLPMSHEMMSPGDAGAGEYLRVMQQETGMGPMDLLRQASAYDLFSFQWGFRPASPSVFTLFTSLFLHAGWLHLFGNMLMLWIFGNNIEARLGPARYLLTYLGCGVVASLAYACAKLSSPLPLIGASGAISGILGCYFVWFPNYRVRVLVTLLIFWKRITVPAWVVLSFYLLVENLWPLLAEPAAHGSGIAHGAHVGGFVAGALYAWGRDRGVWAQLPALHRGRAFRASSQADAIAKGVASMRRWLACGAYEDAWSAFLRLPAPAVGHVRAKEALLLADWLTQEKNYAQAQTLLAEAARVHGSKDVAVAAEVALRRGLVAWRGQRRLEEACAHLRRALAHSGGMGPVAEASRETLDQIQAYAGV